MFTCVLCGASFRGLDSAERCRRALDGGGHEPRCHDFRSGRLDGLCAEPREVGGMCGYRRDDERIHIAAMPAVAQQQGGDGG